MRKHVLLTDSLAVHDACVWEVTARKLGNVHPSASFPGLSILEFSLSADAIRNIIGMTCQAGLFAPIGSQVLNAVRATRAVVNTNTNLGIILLLTPLAAVLPDSKQFPPRELLQRILSELTIDDAKHVYEAIRIANAGGLGESADQDVRGEPTVTLLEAMTLAADRDMVARQYANGFADVFDFGVPAFLDALARFECVEAAIVDSQLEWLSTYPDSLIARKNGLAVAEDVRRRATDVQRLGGIASPEGRRAGVALDRHLRSDGNTLNPGTTADLITACLFVALRENKVAPSAPFRWRVEDWL